MKTVKFSLIQAWALSSVTFIVIFTILGCSFARLLSDQMQPDGSYRIAASADERLGRTEEAKAFCHDRAKKLCPNGFERKAEFVDGQIYQLIVKCQ